MSGLVHPDQNVRNATQNSLCRAVNRRRGCCACRASNCRRRARFSRTRSSRERKTLANQPRKCRSDTIMARIVAEKSESSFAPSHSFCRCTTFGEAQGRTHWQCWAITIIVLPKPQFPYRVSHADDSGIRNLQPGQAFQVNYATSYELWKNVRRGFNGYWLQQEL